MPNPPSTQSVCPTCKGETGHRLGCDYGLSPDTQTEECYEDSHAGYNSETGACLTCGKLVHGVLYGDELRRAEGMCEAPPPDPQGQVEEPDRRNPHTIASLLSHSARWLRADRPVSAAQLAEDIEIGASMITDLASQLDQAERRAEEAKADAKEANHQANMMSRNLQAANALAASYREGLERIAAMGDQVVDGADGEGKVIVCCHPRELDEAAAIARALLNPSSTSEGDA